MTICDTCPLRNACIERRGLCSSYLAYQERVERTRKVIESLNKAQAAGRSGTNKGGVQETGNL